MMSGKIFGGRVIRRILPESVKGSLIEIDRHYRGIKAFSELDKLKIIRQASFEQLRDSSFLENAFIELGLNPKEKRLMSEFPSNLWMYCGKGLRIWQYPNQFSKYLIELSKYRISKYLEIGTENGGTFLTTIEYLRRFNPKVEAWGIDPRRISVHIETYIKKDSSIKYFEDFSQNLYKHFEPYSAVFDLVLVDGNHIGEAPWNDFLMIKDRSMIIAFHDIASDVCPDVAKCWNRLKNEYKDQYNFLEFTEQYKEVIERTGQKFLGIGIAIKKENDA